jgi:hypothetical protein
MSESTYLIENGDRITVITWNYTVEFEENLQKASGSFRD